MQKCESVVIFGRGMNYLVVWWGPKISILLYKSTFFCKFIDMIFKLRVKALRNQLLKSLNAISMETEVQVCKNLGDK